LAYPKKISDRAQTAQILANLLDGSYAKYLAKLKTKKECIYIERHANKAVGEKLSEHHLPGLEIVLDRNRQYPKKSLASQLIGFSDVDGHGLSGIELSCESILNGRPGRAILQKTAEMDGQMFQRSEYPIIPPEDGHDIVLSIDCVYQNIVEKELERSIIETGADSGMVVVMDPRDGRILAMTSKPDFNPNNPGVYAPSKWRLRPITDQFEPGSTFKLVLFSALLNENLIKTDDEIFCENGQYKIMDHILHDTSPHKTLKVEDVLVKSSNIGTAKMALQTDRNLIYKYARDYGFGVETGLELKGEMSGQLKSPKDWSGYTPVAISIGYEVAVTGLQMCNMFCTIANGGHLLKPTIIHQVRKNLQPIAEHRNRKYIRQVIKQSTADSLKDIMHKVVLNGTGRNANLDKIKICGKTGTARMIRRDGRGYLDNRYVASFGGFFPKEDPKICIFVSISNPKNAFYGGSVSAPCFRRIAEQIIDAEGLDYFEKDAFYADNDEFIVPNFIGMRKDAALKLAEKMKIKIKCAGQGNVIVSQTPLFGELLSHKDYLFLMTTEKRHNTLPDVEGLPIRNALNLLASQGIKAVVDGTGLVLQQTPGPGTQVKTGEQVLLRCESSIDVHRLIVM
jgi:cell division protein FtsI/penicillin-binding protein 2